MNRTSASGHVVNTTTKQIISGRRKDEDGSKMYRSEKRSCEEYKNTVFRWQYAHL